MPRGSETADTCSLYHRANQKAAVACARRGSLALTPCAAAPALSATGAVPLPIAHGGPRPPCGPVADSRAPRQRIQSIHDTCPTSSLPNTVLSPRGGKGKREGKEGKGHFAPAALSLPPTTVSFSHGLRVLLLCGSRRLHLARPAAAAAAAGAAGAAGANGRWPLRNDRRRHDHRRHDLLLLLLLLRSSSRRRRRRGGEKDEGGSPQREPLASQPPRGKGKPPRRLTLSRRDYC